MKLYRFQYDVSQWGSFETRYSEEFPHGPWVHSIEELEVFLPSEVAALKTRIAELEEELAAIARKQGVGRE